MAFFALRWKGTCLKLLKKIINRRLLNGNYSRDDTIKKPFVAGRNMVKIINHFFSGATTKRNIHILLTEGNIILRCGCFALVFFANKVVYFSLDVLLQKRVDEWIHCGVQDEK